MMFLPKILVVDDEKRIRSGCVKMLLADGLIADSAETAEASLEKLDQEHYDIILLDLMMPGMSGMDALVHLRSRHPDTVVIVITGYATLEYSVEAMKKGAFDFIPKPFSPEDLRRVVKKAVDHIRTLQDIATETSRMRVLVNQLSDGVLAVDKQERVVLSNKAAFRLMGCEPDVVVGRVVGDVINHPILLDCIRRALFLPKEQSEVEAEINTLDIDSGNGSVLNVRCMPFRDRLERTLGAILVLHDITALKKIDLLKSQFVSMVAHEIRSPMNTVLAQMHVLMEGLVGQVTDKQRELIDRCSQKVNALAEMAGQLLDLSKIESGLSEDYGQEIDLVGLLVKQLDFHRDQAGQRKIGLNGGRIDDGLMIKGNLYQITEAIANLISNAIKYTPEGGSVAISGTRNGNRAVVTVADTGFGIPADELQHVFKRFYRVKNEKTRFIVGSGLGLALVKRIVEAHQGSVRVESVFGEGSSFRIELPLITSRTD